MTRSILPRAEEQESPLSLLPMIAGDPFGYNDGFYKPYGGRNGSLDMRQNNRAKSNPFPSSSFPRKRESMQLRRLVWRERRMDPCFRRDDEKREGSIRIFWHVPLCDRRPS